MYFKQFYLGCLAHASYIVGSRGEAAVIDPQRDVEGYIQEAAAAGLRIKYVIETHLHADFVSGHRELADRAGASIVVGAAAGATFPHRGVSDGEALRIGDVFLWIMETPGHTPESISILAVDSRNPEEPRRVFTGDTMFVGDVGRPDLVGSKGFSKEAMARMLYASLHEKLLKLGDDVEVYPAHGPGSLCGRNLSSETRSTIGNQRRSNYALQPMSQAAFVRLMTTNLPEAPAYFSKDVQRNREGAAPLSDVPAPVAVDPEDLNRLRDTYLVLDVRSAGAFGRAHVPGSLNIGLTGAFAPWAGSLIPLGTPMILVADAHAALEEAITRLARVGHESVEGHLDGGMPAWERAGLEVGTVPQISVRDLWNRTQAGEALTIVDVRRTREFEAEHIPGAVNVPLADFSSLALRFDRLRPIAVVCQSGYRSSAASSLLERMCFSSIYNVRGGTTAWKVGRFPTVQPLAVA